MKKYMLIAFHLTEADKRQDGPFDFLVPLLNSTTHCVELALGLYIFETQKDFGRIRELEDNLRSRNHTFVQLQFDSDICGLFPSKALDAVKAKFPELLVYNLLRY